MNFLKLTASSIVLLLIFSGCIGKPKPADLKVDNSLQVIKLTKHGVYPEMSSIAFEWEFIRDQRVKGIHIFRQKMDMKAKQNIKQIEYYDTVYNRFSTHYVDVNIEPDTKYAYYFQTYNDNYISKKSIFVTTKSLPMIDSVSWISSAGNLPKTAKIIWRPHSNKSVKSYAIERKTLREDTWRKIAIVYGRLNAEFIDRHLEDKLIYKYRIKVILSNGLVSKPSAIVKIQTKKLPEEIDNIKTRSLPKGIEISWNQALESNLSYYNIYRSEKSENGFFLLKKIKNNKYIDNIGESGKQYFYRVCSVTTDGLESKYSKSSIQGLTMPRLDAPSIDDVVLTRQGVVITWEEKDEKTISYLVQKRFDNGMFNEIIEEYEDIRGEKYIDPYIAGGTVYYYKVFAIDKYSIRSEPSIELKIKIPKHKGIAKKFKTQNKPTRPINNTKKTGFITPMKNVDLSEVY